MHIESSLFPWSSLHKKKIKSSKGNFVLYHPTTSSSNDWEQSTSSFATCSLCTLTVTSIFIFSFAIQSSSTSKYMLRSGIFFPAQQSASYTSLSKVQINPTAGWFRRTVCLISLTSFCFGSNSRENEKNTKIQVTPFFLTPVKSTSPHFLCKNLQIVLFSGLLTLYLP